MEAINEHGILFVYDECLKTGKEFSPDYLPDSINIYDAVIQISYHTEKCNMLFLSNSDSRQVLNNLIMKNTEENTGFLLWVSKLSASCIIIIVGLFTHSIAKLLNYNVFTNLGKKIKIYNNV